MKRQITSNFIKTKVIIDFNNEEQAKAFFGLFDKPTGQGLSMISEFLPNAVKVVENTKELKHNYFIRIF